MDDTRFSRSIDSPCEIPQSPAASATLIGTAGPIVSAILADASTKGRKTSGLQAALDNLDASRFDLTDSFPAHPKVIAKLLQTRSRKSTEGPKEQYAQISLVKAGEYALI